MSDTPRTEARLNSDVQFYDEVVDADFARELERELARALRVVDAAARLHSASKMNHDTESAETAFWDAMEEWEAGR